MGDTHLTPANVTFAVRCTACGEATRLLLTPAEARAFAVQLLSSADEFPKLTIPCKGHG